MRRRADAYVVALLMSMSALVMPAVAAASTGGAAVGPANGSAATLTQPANDVTTVSSGGLTVSSRSSGLMHHVLRFRGRAFGVGAGTAILLQRLDPVAGWVTVAQTPVLAGGWFKALWRADRSGILSLRAVVPAAAAAADRSASRPRVGGASVAPQTVNPLGSGSPALTVAVYRPAIATSYGTGFYGQRTACGQLLRPAMLGVAHRTLRCGTPVAILYRGRMIVVPVIDRGPYANHADWDLTEATARALGDDGTAVVGALPGRTMAMSARAAATVAAG